jgi:hypothetical protein
VITVKNSIGINPEKIFEAFSLQISQAYNYVFGARGGVVFKALRYKPAGRGFDSRWCHWNFSVT